MDEIQKPQSGHRSMQSIPGNQTSAEASPERLHLLCSYDPSAKANPWLYGARRRQLESVRTKKN